MKRARSGDGVAIRDWGRLLGAILSLTCHVLILLAVLWTWPQTPPIVGPATVTVELVGPLSPAPAPKPLTLGTSAPAAAPDAAARPSPSVKPPPRRIAPEPWPPVVEDVPAQVAQKADTGATLTEAQLAGAATAGSGGSAAEGAGGGGGGVCDMATRLQAALRKDPMVRAALTGAAGKATLVWNGDWVRSLAEDGKGLATLREAIIWEVGFAPPACRAQAVRGLVVLSVNGAAGPTRIALGSGSWRWSDLLTPHPGAVEASSNE